MTAAQQDVAHPGVDPSDTRDAVARLLAERAITVVAVAPAAIGPCEECPPESPVSPNPAQLLVVHRPSPTSRHLYRDPVCSSHLQRAVRECGDRPVFVEWPVEVLDS